MKMFKTLTKKIFNAAGFTLERTGAPSQSIDSNEYHPVYPSATYSPWRIDNDFQGVYKVIKDYTLVDEYRCYELWSLVREASKLGGDILEVGVWRGGSGALMAKRAENCGNPCMTYLCDTFEGVVKATENDDIYRGGEHSDTSIETVQSLIESLKLKNVTILKGIFPDETGNVLEGSKICLCHIDVDVYQSAKDVTEFVWDKLVRGGIIVYDDYGFWQCKGVTKLVEEQMLLMDRTVIHNLNGHAIVIKK